MLAMSTSVATTTQSKSVIAQISLSCLKTLLKSSDASKTLSDVVMNYIRLKKKTKKKHNQKKLGRKALHGDRMCFKYIMFLLKIAEPLGFY